MWLMLPACTPKSVTDTTYAALVACCKQPDQARMTNRAISSFPSSPVGYVFRPTDEELVNHYLRLKMHGGYEQEVSIIAEVNVCDFEPWVLPGLSTYQSNDPECYFFCPRSYKYVNSHRANRTTAAGYWKVTGKNRIIKAKSTKEPIATKKTLVFYENRVPNGVKTDWVMHEYHPTFSFHNQRDFVLCKLKKYPDENMPTFEESESSSNVPHGFGNQNPTVRNYPLIFEEGGHTAQMASNLANNRLEEDINQLRTQLESFRGFDDGDYDLNSALQFSPGS
ncbi:protein NTM1-like 9 [Populus alba x Populus x berolinensis]|uniref:Protein NTM1-like 9 n=1 Tax=Populus alba x Populus x berolinensis TaxID=444605 RepID=A0AAD6RFL2_9ROSI|nr:protein NTM1-like 9 [Populus alba x Populus x berolinensis]